MLITNTEDRLDLANSTSFFHDNIVMLEIDNMLSGWPTYTLDFTPERPGPLKIILHLRDAVKFRVIEDENSDNEAGWQGNSTLQSDTTMVCEPTLAPKDPDMPQRINAKPVVLHVIPKDSPSIIHMREKFEDDHGYTWPPRRGFRECSNRTQIAQVDAFMTLPAAVEALNLN
ncbi:hypothetical protein EV702DRAFT_1199095 [Suillus placidus]|uniref:Uncharacterized protein n=1 Tax=Suillus placidus TaxID=48579 RepID=A0A9P6ZRU3_9AGAM|nr:hypothetical protein EV702DRAFT_1199095 [Suillus placidus]